MHIVNGEKKCRVYRVQAIVKVELELIVKGINSVGYMYVVQGIHSVQFTIL